MWLRIIRDTSHRPRTGGERFLLTQPIRTLASPSIFLPLADAPTRPSPTATGSAALCSTEVPLAEAELTTAHCQRLNASKQLAHIWDKDEMSSMCFMPLYHTVWPQQRRPIPRSDTADLLHGIMDIAGYLHYQRFDTPAFRLLSSCFLLFSPSRRVMINEKKRAGRVKWMS